MMDFHCHLDLYPGAREVYREAARRNEFTWLVTTSPKAFAATSSALEPLPSVLITPGLHPEIAQERAAELDLLLEQIARVKAVGEVGLDGSPRFKVHYEVQRRIFGAVIARSAELGGRTLSVHSRCAVRDVLAELKRHPNFGTVVMHWFSGSLAELKAAAAHGCWFSIGPAMFESANGRALAAAMPRDRVVPESDGPFAKVAGKPIMPWNAIRTAEGLGPLWGLSNDEAAETLARNGCTLLRTMDRG
ncbi:Qat anti-phage system TatD family nuclease QatD [Methylomonas sp. OY6]|uniref:Qat anti-phage system TatD family nuclease QatD n=1 Tax=Methylomonas defluvii TaxID=3045149 RepID=A0ABU4UBF0_9GAMM|nr:Qat anti-phage system TatD family nuclease QatD [Methylomonas sp. OY6]MDX8126767.1 Qat anti-phage system TatD family nuclease QatD [Methylomonas sp. OY6]